MTRFVGKCLVNTQGTYQVQNLEIRCCDEKILEISEKNDIAANVCGVLIPRFFNIHSHLGESIFRSINGNEWTISKYIEYTERYNEKLSEEQKKDSWLKSAEFSTNEMIYHGTIGFCAARSAEIAASCDMLTMSGYPIMNSHKLIEYKRAGIDGFLSYLKNNKSINNKIGVFLHSVYANDDDSFELARHCLEQGAEFVTVHVSEDEETVNLEWKTHGMSAVSLLEQNGLIMDKTILIHCGWCTDEDLRIIKDRGATICVCPISNRFLNTKMIDLYKLEALGIPWCIATDGLATGRTFSLLKQLGEAQREYPNISWEKYFKSITAIPGSLFNNVLYSGNIEIGVRSAFLRAEYDGYDANELIKGMVEGSIGYEPIQV